MIFFSEGWTSPTGQRVENRIRELAPFADTFLVTFVEREGRMGGVDVAGVTTLATIAKECGVKLTIAGGITTEKDILTLDQLGCEAQVIGNVFVLIEIFYELICFISTLHFNLFSSSSSSSCSFFSLVLKHIQNTHCIEEIKHKNKERE